LLHHICLFLHFSLFLLRPPPRPPLFPTRRSSDLPRSGDRASPAPTPTADRRRIPSRAPGTSRRRPRPAPGSSSGCRRTSRQRRRSEEHTSELQSRSDLVCRLLLEKKKKIDTHVIA